MFEETSTGNRSTIRFLCSQNPEPDFTSKTSECPWWTTSNFIFYCVTSKASRSKSYEHSLVASVPDDYTMLPCSILAEVRRVSTNLILLVHVSSKWNPSTQLFLQLIILYYVCLDNARPDDPIINILLPSCPKYTTFSFLYRFGTPLTDVKAQMWECTLHERYILRSSTKQ